MPRQAKKDIMKKLSKMLEWIRPVGIGLVYFLAEYLGTDAISKFHILGPVVVILMSGTVAFESLILGEAASEKIGYKPNRAYQIQSGLNHLAIAFTALFVFVVDWGQHADATIVTTMLLFFVFSALNHIITAFKEHNMKAVNLMRPIMTLLLIGLLLPSMSQALLQ